MKYGDERWGDGGGGGGGGDGDGGGSSCDEERNYCKIYLIRVNVLIAVFHFVEILEIFTYTN